MMEFGVVNWFAEVISVLLVLALLGGIVIIVAICVVDVTQTASAIRRNYPIIGRFRYLFETLGEFFRQYFFAMDREEMPFNRAEPSWVYRAAKNVDSTVPFGSTRSLTTNGTVLFVNCPFPTLEGESAQLEALTIGPYNRYPSPRPLYSIFRI